MRILLAALFVFTGTCVVAVVLLEGLPKGFSPLLGGAIMGVILLLLVVVAGVLFHPPGARPFGFRRSGDFVRHLEEKGLLSAEAYRAVRAFGVEELEDEGSHYFLELEDGGVLFLSGQYLYDYEAMDEDTPGDGPPPFPCSEFTLRRHRHEGYVVEIVCGGRYLPLEVVAPPFGPQEMREDDMPEDGQIIRDRTYDEVKAARLSLS